jgi:hypothetical protein
MNVANAAVRGVVQTVPRRFLPSKYHTFSLFTRKFNFIYFYSKVRISVSDIKFCEHPNSESRTDMIICRRTDGMTKLIDSFRDFANRLKRIHFISKNYTSVV